MEIKFYQNSDDKRVISKTLGTAKTLSSCQLIDESSIINPVIEIDIDTSLYAYNYAYIAYFGRYYYITNITVLDGARMRVTMAVDVLMSFATQILACNVNSRRNEKSFDLYLPDDRPVESRYIKFSKNFPHSFDDETGSYILITVGNGQTNLT